MVPMVLERVGLDGKIHPEQQQHSPKGWGFGWNHHGEGGNPEDRHSLPARVIQVGYIVVALHGSCAMMDYIVPKTTTPDKLFSFSLYFVTTMKTLTQPP